MQQNEVQLLTRDDIVEMDDKHGFERYGTIPEAWLGVPFVLSDNTSGIIVVQSYLPSVSYTEGDKSLLDFVSQHLSTTLKYKRAQEQIQHQALHDSLTGLPNRSLFNDRLQHTLNRNKRADAGFFAILFLDLDHFKDINDNHGHHVGDRVLQEVSKRLRSCVRAEDTVARFGGDEFAILLESISDENEVVETANRIIYEIEKDFFVDDKECLLSTSIGIRCCTTETDIEELIKNADIAMYQAKQSGRGCYSLYLQDQKLIESGRNKIRRELRQAIQNDEFELYYQPVVLLKDLSIVSFEVLVRWNHPKRGLLAPVEFIDVAEETGLITEIDLQVMKKAILQKKQWLRIDSKTADFSVNINLSARHFSDDQILHQIKDLLSLHQLPGKQLNIEITETALIESLDIMTSLVNQMKELNVSILLDDFGTGYSSLSYLHQFPINALKIDRSFISNIAIEGDDNPIISTIVALAESMSMSVVAERN